MGNSESRKPARDTFTAYDAEGEGLGVLNGHKMSLPLAVQ